jgi:hypothetical protein
MVFNPDLSKQAVEVLFSRKSVKSILMPLTFNNIPVKKVDETKHLGMVLDSELSFESHLEGKDGKLPKARQGLGLLRQLKKWLSSPVLETIYKLYVRPHLDYGDVIYHKANLNKINLTDLKTTSPLLWKAEIIQYEAARIVTGAWNRTSIERLYENLGWESLNNRRIMRKLCILHDTIENKFPRYLHAIVDERQYAEGHRLRNSKRLKNIICKKTNYKTTFFPSTIIDWNNLEIEIKNITSQNVFKKRMLTKIRPKKSSYFGLLDNDKVRYLTMLRMELSPLRAHKKRYNFLDTSDDTCLVCECPETTEHYLLECHSFRHTRDTMLQNISLITNVDLSTLPRRRLRRILLYGMDDKSNNVNLEILLEVTKFIQKSKRLDY